MKKKTLLNPKGAGRKGTIDPGIRHTHRPHLGKLTPLHLTVKVSSLKNTLRSKGILKALHRAIMRARLQGLAIIHYTLEFDHVHLLVEATSNEEVGRGMQSFGITFAKLINKILGRVGSVYKTRYHFHKLKSPREVKNALSYIFNNSIKHRYSRSPLSLFNSLPIAKKYLQDLKLDSVVEQSMLLSRLRRELAHVVSLPRSYLVYHWV